MNFIRKNKEKSNKNSTKTLDLPPSLPLPSFSSDVSVPIVATSPRSLASPLPESSLSSSSPPLYVKFARGTFELQESEPLLPPPRHTLRHRASNDSGTGFRSSGVRDEVERLVVAKRSVTSSIRNGRDSSSIKAPSIRSGISGRDSPLPSLSEAIEQNPQPRRFVSQPSVILPRPPTPPPPSPPKIIFAKSLPTSSPEKSLPVTPSLPSPPPPAPILKSPLPKTTPLSTPTPTLSALTSSPDASPVASRKRVYSPLAAFHSVKDNSNGSLPGGTYTSGKERDTVPSGLVSSPTPTSTATSAPTTPASTLFTSMSPSTGTSTWSTSTNANSSTKSLHMLVTPSSSNSNELSSDPSTPGGFPASPLRNSPITGPGLAGMLRAASISRNSNKNGIAVTGISTTERESSPVKASPSPLRDRGYFATYPEREKVRKVTEDPEAPHPIAKVDLPSPVSNREHPTPISTRPSKSSISAVDDDDPNLQAFVKNFPSSVSRHTTGDSESSSVASNILASATFGETNRRIPRGARLSRVGSNFSGTNGIEESHTSPTQTPSRKTSASLFEESFTSKIPTVSANASTSTLNSISTHSREYNHNSTPSTPSSNRIASKSESVRERVRALEEEREREKEKERMRRSNPWVRKDGTVGVIKSKKEEKGVNKGGRSASSSTQRTVIQQAPHVSPPDEEEINLPTQESDNERISGDVNLGPQLNTVQPLTPLSEPLDSTMSTSPSTQVTTDARASSERPMNEKTMLPSLIPIAIHSPKPPLVDLKPLPTPNGNNLADLAAEVKEVNLAADVTSTGAFTPINKAEIGALNINGTVSPSTPPRALPAVPSVLPSQPDTIVESRIVAEPHTAPAVSSRLRSGSTFGLDDDPFVRGPVIRQGMVPAGASIPVRVTTTTSGARVEPVLTDNDSQNKPPKLFTMPLDNVAPHSTEVVREANGDDLATVVPLEESSVVNGSDEPKILKKELPSLPSAAPVIETAGEANPSPAPANDFQRQHKHKESVVTTYSNESDAERSDEVGAVDQDDGVDTESVTPPLPPYPLERHLFHPYLFHSLLKYLSYVDVLTLLSVNHSIRRSLTEIQDLREEILERFLRAVGYIRWVWQGKEPLVISLKDLNAYLRGVSTPLHEYATIADAYLVQQAGDTIPASRILRSLAASCRSYTRLIIRLREQAEAEYAARGLPHAPVSPGSPSSPTSIKHARHVSIQSATFSADSHDTSNVHNQHRFSASSGALQNRRFSSPLFRLHHAPLLRLFVPSANGAWLSDESVLECEKELKRSGVLPFLRPGDVIWDTAVAEEMNAGRLVWDGSYLIDLDYSYTLAGELPRYLHSLSFPPSYFHKVIQANGNPLCQIDISPWGLEIINNVQLVQDKAVTNTPQGGQRSMLRWVHRSRFQILPSTPIPDSDGLIVDPKWVGTVVVETEGTNEGLGNLLGRCGEQIAAKAETMTGGLSNTMGKGEIGRAFRLIRSQSRPGEIWLRCVSEKEKLV